VLRPAWGGGYVLGGVDQLDGEEAAGEVEYFLVGHLRLPLDDGGFLNVGDVREVLPQLLAHL
jgi:hypothetical protein